MDGEIQHFELSHSFSILMVRSDGLLQQREWCITENSMVDNSSIWMGQRYCHCCFMKNWHQLKATTLQRRKGEGNYIEPCQLSGQTRFLGNTQTDRDMKTNANRRRSNEVSSEKWKRDKGFAIPISQSYIDPYTFEMVQQLAIPSMRIGKFVWPRPIETFPLTPPSEQSENPSTQSLKLKK